MKGTMFMKQILYFSEPELWYPYSEPGVTHFAQGTAGDQDDFANPFANSPYHSRLEGLSLGS